MSLSRTATLLFFYTQQFVCIKNGPPLKGHPTWGSVGSIGVNMGQYPCGALSTPCSPCPGELRLYRGQKGVQLNIRKVFLIVCTLGIIPAFIHISTEIAFKHTFL